VRYATIDGRPAAIVDGRAVALGGYETLDALIAAGPEAWARAARKAAARAGAAPALDGRPLGPPVRRPSKIVGIGLNYHDHAREAALPLPERPLVFAKYPSALAGDGEPIAWPAGLTSQVDWEVELAVIVGRRLRGAAPAAAIAAVFGYTVANDVSARDLQFSEPQWTRSKSLDTFCPLGPVVVTPDELGDPQGLRLAARVNGETMQESSTDQMIFGVAEILSFLSRSFTLEPGDVVLTGTPHGVGAFRSPPRYLRAGDVVEVEVEGIGTLTNPVRAAVGAGADHAAQPVTKGRT